MSVPTGWHFFKHRYCLSKFIDFSSVSPDKGEFLVKLRNNQSSSSKKQSKTRCSRKTIFP